MKKQGGNKNFCVVRHIALNILKNMDDKMSAARRRRHCAYDDAYLLTTAVLPDNLVRIESQAFANGSFQAVIIPDSCTYIGAEAFKECLNLVYVSYPAGINIDDSAFDGCNIRKTDIR